MAILSSCVAYQTGNLNSTSAGSKFIYEDVAIGTAKADRFLGLGGMRKDALVAEAKRQLMTARPLNQGEEYINFTVDFKHSYFYFMDRSKVTITADVIRHTDIEPKDRYTPLYLNKMFQVNMEDNLFKIGDWVTTNKLLKGQILSISKEGKAVVSLKNKKQEIITRTVNLYQIYNMVREYKGLKPQQNYQIPNSDMKEYCKIIGLGKTKILLQNPDGSFHFVKYPNQ
jgi:hypothetical protein